MSKRKADSDVWTDPNKRTYTPRSQLDASVAAIAAIKNANPKVKVPRKFHPDMMLLSRPPKTDTSAPMDTGDGVKKRRRRCKTCGSLPKRGKGV